MDGSGFCQSTGWGGAVRKVRISSTCGIRPERRARILVRANWDDRRRYRPDIKGQRRRVDFSLKKVNDRFKMYKNGTLAPDENALFTIFRDYSSLGLPDKVVEVQEFMESCGFELAGKHFLVLMKAFIKARQMSKALDCFDEIKARNLNVGCYFYSQLIGSFGRAKCLDEVRFLKKMVEEDQVKLDIYVYNAFIDAFMKNGDTKGAKAMFDALAAEEDLVPNAVTFNTLINGMARRRDLNGALQIFQAMQDSGVKADVLTYNSMIDASAKCNDTARARKYISEMAEAGIKPTTVSYNSLIFVYTNRRDMRVSKYLCGRGFASMRER